MTPIVKPPIWSAGKTHSHKREILGPMARKRKNKTQKTLLTKVIYNLDLTLDSEIRYPTDRFDHDSFVRQVLADFKPNPGPIRYKPEKSPDLVDSPKPNKRGRKRKRKTKSKRKTQAATITDEAAVAPVARANDDANDDAVIDITVESDFEIETIAPTCSWVDDNDRQGRLLRYPDEGRPRERRRSPSWNSNRTNWSSVETGEQPRGWGSPSPKRRHEW